MPGTHQQFTPSASATFRAAGSAPVAITLPAVDGANPAVLLQNLGPGVLIVVAGTGGGSPLGSIGSSPNAILLQHNEVRLLPTDAGFGAGTVATIQSPTGGGATLQFSRGAVTPAWLFPARAVAVI